MRFNTHQTVIFIENEELQDGIIIRAQTSSISSQLNYVILYADPDGNVFTTIVDDEDIFTSQDAAFEYVFCMYRESKSRHVVREYLQNSSLRDYMLGCSLIDYLKHKNLIVNGNTCNNECSKPVPVCIKG